MGWPEQYGTEGREARDWRRTLLAGVVDAGIEDGQRRLAVERGLHDERAGVLGRGEVARSRHGTRGRFDVR